MEDFITEWYTEAALPHNAALHKKTLDLSVFHQNFEVKEVLIGGIDFSSWKIILKAKKEGMVASFLNTHIRIKKDALTCEIKRVGFIIDRHIPLEINLGDIVILYVTAGGYEK